MLKTEAVTTLLARLCVDPGFCLLRQAQVALLGAAPTTPREFTDAVFLAEGLDPQIADKRLYAQVWSLVSQIYETAAAWDVDTDDD